jgi:hypothetical protein
MIGFDWAPSRSRVNPTNPNLRVEPNPAKKPDSAKTRVSTTYPQLVIVKRCSPTNGGGVWLHPDLATYPDARYRSASANSIALTFVHEEGVQLFLRGLAFYPRLRPVVVGVEVAVTYLD